MYYDLPGGNMDLLALIEERGNISMEEATKACGGDEEEASTQLICLYRDHKVVLIQGETENLVMSVEAFGRMIVQLRDVPGGKLARPL